MHKLKYIEQHFFRGNRESESSIKTPLYFLKNTIFEYSISYKTGGGFHFYFSLIFYTTMSNHSKQKHQTTLQLNKL